MKIGLLGHGVVGSGVRKIVDDGLTWEVRELEITKILVKDESEITDERMTLNPDDILDDPEIDVIAECMGGLEPAHSFLARALKNGKHVVTSNKKMLATYCEELFDLARENSVTVHYEASCGGGIPWMAALDRTRRVDDIESFRGIFNGTTNYILCSMTRDASSFDEALKEAQKLGYAEADPTDDVDGCDVRYKVALSVVKGFDSVISVNDIITYGIRNITRADLQYCFENDYTVKLIGTGKFHDDHISACVIPMFIRNEDLFSDISLNFNAIESDSKTLGRATFIGQGAGSLPTAHAVVQNLIDIWKDQDSEINPKFKKPVDNSTHEGIYYIRTKKPEVFAEVLDRMSTASALLTKKSSLLRVSQLVKEADDESLFIAEVSE